MLKAMKRFFVEEEGISSVEYAILLAFIAVALITAVVFLRDEVIASFNDGAQDMQNARTK
jgi:Flp pilus assembly pilin Flp